MAGASLVLLSSADVGHLPDELQRAHAYLMQCSGEHRAAAADFALTCICMLSAETLAAKSAFRDTALSLARAAGWTA